MERTERPWFTVLLTLLAILLALAIAAGTVWAFASGRAHPGQKTASGQNSTASSRSADPAGTSGDGGSSLDQEGKHSLFTNGQRNPAQAEVAAADATGKTVIFGEIGVLRAITADRQPVTVVITPFFPYPADDPAFREELVQKTPAIRMAILGWFNAHTILEIGRIGEAGVKQELIGGINALLVLGRISIIYFDEYMVLD